MLSSQLVLLGAVIGVPLGYAMQRTRLCFNSAYRQVLLHHDTTLLRAIVFAVTIQMVGLYVIAQFGLGDVQVNVVPFVPVGNIGGGLVFGLAMVYAEGCSSTVWYRVGNGNLGALVTLVGFAVGEAFMEAVVFAQSRDSSPAAQASIAASPATLPNVLGINPWIIIVPIVLLAVIWLWRGKSSRYLEGWNWQRGGLVLGVIGTLAWLAAWPTGWHYGIGVVGATGPWVRALFEGQQVLNWGSFMVLAMPLGALIAALRHHEFHWQVPDWPSTLRMGTAGLIMGISATVAGGCNVGHGLTGVPTLALSSLAATLFTFLGAAVGNYLRFVRPQRFEFRTPPV
jgi:uncharacterized membrane protein YedE/YeeE